MAGLFGSNSSFGVSSLFGNNSSSVLSDWAFIRSGTYKKLMKAYYGQDKTTKSATESAKTNKTKTIGIIIPELNNIFCAEIITEVEDQLRSHGYATMICDCRTDEKREEEAVEFLLHRRED